jgi:hypothetical protein
MGRTDQSDPKLVSQASLPVSRRSLRSRFSSGHILMIVSGLAAVVLSVMFLRQAAGLGTVVLVAARTIDPGETVSERSFRTARVKLTPDMVGIVFASDQMKAANGRIARVRIPGGSPIVCTMLGEPARFEREVRFRIDRNEVPSGVHRGSLVDIRLLGAPEPVAEGVEVTEVIVPGSRSLPSESATSITIGTDAEKAGRVASVERDRIRIILHNSAPGPASRTPAAEDACSEHGIGERS